MLLKLMKVQLKPCPKCTHLLEASQEMIDKPASPEHGSECGGTPLNFLLRLSIPQREKHLSFRICTLV